jgi:hypothetical protein
MTFENFKFSYIPEIIVAFPAILFRTRISVGGHKVALDMQFLMVDTGIEKLSQNFGIRPLSPR